MLPGRDRRSILKKIAGDSQRPARHMARMKGARRNIKANCSRGAGTVPRFGAGVEREKRFRNRGKSDRVRGSRKLIDRRVINVTSARR